MDRCEIEPLFNFKKETQRIIEDGLRKLVGSEMSIEIYIIDSIKIDPSSKFRFVSSKINKSF